MRAIADRFGIESFEYTNISPTIHGGDEVLPSQSREMPRTRKPYVGCNAGITHFHADPHGKASICKVGHDPPVDLIAEGAGGLRRLADAADLLLTWHGGCAGCTLQKTCGTCMPLASLYRQGHPGPRGRGRPARPGHLPGPAVALRRRRVERPRLPVRARPPRRPGERQSVRRRQRPAVGRDRAVEHKRLDSQDGTSREVMDCPPPGSLSPADDAPGAATPASLPASRTQGAAC
jgi:hypothetical protein